MEENGQLKMNDPKLLDILEKTLGLFYELGIRNVNMDDICHELKISKKTLYQYVKSKEDLIEKLFDYEEKKWDKKFLELKLDELNAIDILIKVSSLVFEEFNKLNAKLKFELKKYYKTIFDEFTNRKLFYVSNHISKNIERGIKEGLYRSDVNINLVAGLYVRGLVNMHEKDYFFVENITFEQVLETMFESLIRSISTPEGLSYYEKRKSEITIINTKNNNQ